MIENTGLQTPRDFIVAGFSGTVNYAFQKYKERKNTAIWPNRPELRPLVIAEMESFLVAVNPIAIHLLLQSPLPGGEKALALTGLFIANAAMMFAARRLGTEMAAGGGTELGV